MIRVDIFIVRLISFERARESIDTIMPRQLFMEID